MTNGLQGAITWALELTAAGMIIQYWNSSINIGVWIAIFWVMFTAINFIPVKWYGEMEYWFVSIKVVTILGFLIFAVCTDLCNPLLGPAGNIRGTPVHWGSPQHNGYALGPPLWEIH